MDCCGFKMVPTNEDNVTRFCRISGLSRKYIHYVDVYFNDIVISYAMIPYLDIDGNPIIQAIGLTREEMEFFTKYVSSRKEDKKDEKENIELPVDSSNAYSSLVDKLQHGKFCWCGRVHGEDYIGTGDKDNPEITQ